MKISTFDLNLFVVLNAIYTEGSLTKAAEVVGTTQPAVSNALSRLTESDCEALGSQSLACKQLEKENLINQLLN